VQAARIIAATLACALLVLGISFLVGSGQAKAGPVTHTCSAPDKQFLATVDSNMVQLGYWSDELGKRDAEPGLVVHQVVSGADQLDATRPTDPSLAKARPLLRAMFLEYAKSVRARAKGGDAGTPMRIAYIDANVVHDLLVDAQPPLAAMGCDPAVLLH
jgi:hypothetical protein